MSRTIRLIVSISVVLSVLFTMTGATAVRADTISTSFDSYAVGNINGQDGWSKTGAYDVAVVANTYGYASFGSHSLRISDAVTSGSFGDQTFAKPLVNAVGEAAATAGSFSVGTRKTHFEMQFDIASTQLAQQPGMHVSVSPDRGDGSRMSYLRFEDGAAGINIFFDDTPGTTNPANFNETQIATGLSRAVPHTIKLTMDTLDGPSNDVVIVYIDGTLIHTGTSWENYYRYDSEAASEQSTRIVKTVLFRVSGPATLANAGLGYLIDNFTTFSGPTASTIVLDGAYAAALPNGYNNPAQTVQGITTDHVIGSGAWQAIPAGTPGTLKFELSVAALATLGTELGAFKLNDIASISYQTKKTTPITGNDFYLLIYTQKGAPCTDVAPFDSSWYCHRLIAHPMYVKNANGPANTWNTWTTNSGANQLTFYDTKHGTSGPTLAEVAAPYTWSSGTPALTDYSGEDVLDIRLAVDGGLTGFNGLLDDIQITLKNGNSLTLDLEGPSALVFNPTTRLIGVGVTTTVNIDLNSVTSLYGYQFQVNYDQTRVSATGAFVNSFFDTTADAYTAWNADCSTPGVCKFSATKVAPATPLNGSGPVATITFTGVTPGVVPLTFSADILSDRDANAITHTAGTGTLTVYGFTTVTGKIKLQGRPVPIDAGTVTLTDLGGNFPPISIPFSATTGDFAASNVPALPAGSSYQIDAAHSLYLSNSITHSLLPGVAYTPTPNPTTLKGGDANNNSTIEIGDLACMGNDFGTANNNCIGGNSDITADGIVNILDLVLAGGNFGLATPQPW